MRLAPIILLVLCACSASQKLRKAKELIAEAEAKGAKVKHDTVFVNREIKVPGESTIVTIPVTKTKDTVIYLTQDRIKIREIVKHDTIKEFIQCPDSLLKMHSAAAVNNIIECPAENHFWRTVALVLAVILTLILGFTYLKPKL